MLCGKKQQIALNDEKKSSVFEPIGPQNYDATQHSIFIGHGVIYDLKSIGLADVPYICTAKVDQSALSQARKLKDLCADHLNAEIQTGHHSSIIDARASLALFLQTREQFSLDLYGPGFHGAEDIHSSTSYGARRRQRNKLAKAGGIQMHMLGPDDEGNSFIQSPPQKTSQADLETMMRSMNMIECELVRLILSEQNRQDKENGTTIQADRRYQIDVNLLKSAIEQVVAEAVREIKIGA